MAGVSGDQKLAADSVRRFAVKAFARLLARRFHIKSLRVCRCCYIPGALHRLVQIGAHLVHSDDEYDFSRSLRDAGNTIGISVNIYHDPIACYRICTGEKNT